MKLSIITLALLLGGCSSIHKTFIYPKDKGEKIFAGTTNNINWISNPPSEQEIYPYSVMGIITQVGQKQSYHRLKPIFSLPNFQQKIDYV